MGGWEQQEMDSRPSVLMVWAGNVWGYWWCLHVCVWGGGGRGGVEARAGVWRCPALSRHGWAGQARTSGLMTLTIWGLAVCVSWRLTMASNLVLADSSPNLAWLLVCQFKGTHHHAQTPASISPAGHSSDLTARMA